MLSGNYNFQYIDWAHDPIPGEEFEHLGNLVTHLITPTITIGLSDYLNISYKQAIGVRAMDWMGDEESAHHRDENSLEDFLNATGNIFGDANINLKYLLTNTGLQSGSRIFLGAGLTIPSNNVLTESPFLTNEDGTAANEHRHFSLSDGSYKTNFELQYYIKRKPKNWFEPAFYGITFNYITPIKESKYGYLPGDNYIGIGSILFSTKSKESWKPKGFSLGLSYIKTEQAFWDDEISPNSEAELFIPSIGMIWNHMKYGGFSLNLKYVQNNSIIPEDAPDSNVKSFEISIGYRKTLSYTIPWLYY